MLGIARSGISHEQHHSGWDTPTKVPLATSKMIPALPLYDLHHVSTDLATGSSE